VYSFLITNIGARAPEKIRNLATDLGVQVIGYVEELAFFYLELAHPY
jgi:hypothetical protein